MKNFKKFTAAVAATLIAATLSVPMAMSLPAMAEGETGTITINDASGATHNTLSAYQIFTVTTATVGEETQVQVTGWGAGIDGDALITALKADDTLGSTFTDVTYENSVTGAQNLADAIGTLTEITDKEALARIIAKNVTGDGTAAIKNETTGNLEIADLEEGYYVIVDTSAANKDNYTAYTLGMLTVLAGTTANANTKIDFPSFDKQIGDINDSQGGDYTYNEAADHDMGDNVPFRLKATVPSNIDKYDTYKMIFHDNLEAAVFSFNNDVTVKYFASSTSEGVDVTSAFTTTTTGLSTNEKFSGTHEGETNEDFTVSCSDIKSITGVTVEAGGYFVVDYTATLTTEAKMGATGNWNSAYLEYSNNPNVSGAGETDNTGTSPEDSVVAFTYQTVIDKIDGISNQPLSGAEFTLYKKDADGNYQEVVAAVKANADTTFVFNGLDDGDYKLEETTPPENYNQLDPIEFTITATEIQTDGAEALESLSGGDNFTTGKVYILTNTATEEGAEPVYTASNENGANNGSLHYTAPNYKGAKLPETGGMGTTLFYVGGGCMVAVAGIFLITKKRMGKKEN